MGSGYSWQGRVEIFLSGVWGTVSDDGAGTTDAAVVCRQLGYSTYSKVQYYILSLIVLCCDSTDLLYYSLSQSHSDVGSNCCARFGPGTDPIHINSIACSGSEYRVIDCPYDDTDTLSSSHNEDWNVYCQIG